MLLKLRKLLSSDVLLVVILFLLAAAIRLIPEIKAGVWPIGYDTFNTYAAELASYNGPLINWVKTANIHYFLFLPLKHLGASPDLIVKIFGPLFYGFLICSFYTFLRRFLKFGYLKAFLTSFLIIFQLAALRLSWDLYRNELALSFLFLGLIYLPKISQFKNLFYFSLFAVLIVLSNQLVTVILLVIMIVYGLSYLWHRRWEDLVAILISLVISGIFFSIVLHSSGQILYNPHVMFTSEKNYFWRYFYQYDEIIPYNQLLNIIWGLFWLLYGWLLILAIYGSWFFRKNLALMTMTIWLLLGTFSSLVFLGRGLIVWDRWLFMLIFPLIIFTVEAVFQLGQKIGSYKKWSQKMPWLSYGLAAIFWLGFLGVFVFRAIPFLSASYSDAKPPLANDKLNSYFPRTMVHNSLGLSEMKDTIQVVDWLNKRAPSGSIIVVDNRYRGLMLTRFDIDNRYILTNPWSETMQRENLEIAKATGHQPVYVIWNISKSIDGFDRIYNSGNRAIYVALPKFYEN